MIRPARIGLLVHRPPMRELRAAVEAATSAWGGVYFPIVDVARSGDHLRRMETLGVDAVWAITEDPATEGMASASGFRWAGGGAWGPFSPPESAMAQRTLSSEWLVGLPNVSTVLPSWADRHPLGDLFATWFGSFGDNDDAKARAARFLSRGEAIEVGSCDQMLAVANATTPIALTAREIQYIGYRPGSAGAVVVDPADPADLLRFWNLRACGVNVVPWPLGHEDVVEPIVRIWLEQLIENDWLPRLARGDGAPLPPHIGVWLQRGETALPSGPLRELLNEYHLEPWLAGAGTVGRLRGQHPLMTEFTRLFDIEIDARAGSATIPLPRLPWPNDHRPGNWPGVVALDVDLYRESGLDPERTAAIPRVRRLCSLQQWLGRAWQPFQRPNGEGGIYAVQAADDSFQIPLAHPTAIMEKLIDNDALKVSQSDEGRFAARLGMRLGLPLADVANQPALREVLLAAARRDEAGVKYNTLFQIALKFRGPWPESVLLDRRTPEQYARNLILWLLERKLLQTVLPVRCPSCRSNLRITPDDLSAEICCSFCDLDFPLALAITSAGPKHSDWLYRVAGHVPYTRLQSALPVLSVTSVLASLTQGGFDTQPQTAGLEIAESGRGAEFDIATVVDTFRPVVVLGEVKSHKPIDNNDVENLAWAQELFRSKGVECVILIATMEEALTDGEVQILRRYCERAPRLIQHDGSLAAMTLPIVLVKRQLSVDRHSDDHPYKWSHPGRGITSVALASCQTNLGLGEFDLADRDEEGMPRLRWADGSRA